MSDEDDQSFEDGAAGSTSAGGTSECTSRSGRLGRNRTAVNFDIAPEAVEEDDIFGSWRKEVENGDKLGTWHEADEVDAQDDCVRHWVGERFLIGGKVDVINVAFVVVCSLMIIVWNLRISYVAASAAAQGRSDKAGGVLNTQSDASPATLFVVLTSYFLGLFFAACMLLSTDGYASARLQMLDFNVAWRWCLLSLAFITSSCFIYSYIAIGQVLGNSRTPPIFDPARVPFAVGVSAFMFKRWFGKLEWLAIGIMWLAMATFAFLRFVCVGYGTGCKELSIHVNLPGILVLLAALLVEVISRGFAERLFKSQSFGLLRVHGEAGTTSFWAHLCYHNFWCLFFLVGLFVLPIWLPFGADYLGWSGAEYAEIFLWKRLDFATSIVLAAYVVLCNVVLQHQSLVTLAILKLICSGITFLIYDPWIPEMHFESRKFQSVLVVGIMILSAVMFQTGRLNEKSVRLDLAIHKDHEVSPGGWSDSMHRLLEPPRRVGLPEGGQDSPSELKTPCTVIAAYSVVIGYVLSQALREVLDQSAMSSGVIVPASIPLVNGINFLILSNAMTYHSFGTEGLKMAWEPREVMRYMVIAALFAVSRFLNTMAFAFGTPAAAKDAASKIYIPASVIFSSCLLDKRFIWLEWLTLSILTLASALFAMVSTVTDDGTQAGSMLGIGCAMVAGVVGAFNCLLMEKFMKDESAPYVVQKVRTDFGIVVFSTFFLFVQGWIGEWLHFPNMAFWEPRPLSGECVQSGFCDANGTYSFNANVTQEVLAFDCGCGSGLFVGWGSTWVVYGCTLSSVAFSHFSGLVVKQFSSIMRCIGDGMNLFVIYFILEPIVDQAGFPPGSLAQTSMVLIIPLSSAAFSVAANEMKKVVLAKNLRWESEGGGSRK